MPEINGLEFGYDGSEKIFFNHRGYIIYFSPDETDQMIQALTELVPAVRQAVIDNLMQKIDEAKLAVDALSDQLSQAKDKMIVKKSVKVSKAEIVNEPV